MTRAAIYSRISRDPEDEGLGVRRQEKDCRDLVAARGWTPVPFVDNDVSASVPFAKRPAGRELLAALAAGEVDHVVAWATDRLYRNVPDQLAVLEAVAERGGVIATVRDGEIDSTSEAGEMQMGILANVAQFELKRKRARILRKQRELAEKGLWHGGPRPFGFRPVDAREGMSLAVVAEEAEAIRDAAARILDGEALRSVVRRWNAAGLRTPKRRRDGNGSKKRGGNEWTAKALKGVLTSPAVAGDREHRGEIAKRNAWPPILDRRTWRRVVAEFERRAEDAAERGLPRSRRYPLTGFLRCATCGDALVGHPVHGVRSYTCLSRKPHPPGAKPRIRAVPLEEYVVGLAAEREVAATSVRDPATVAPELQSELDEIEDRLANWAREAAAAGLSAAEIREGRKPLTDRRAELESEIAERTAATASRFSWIREWVAAGAPEPSPDDPELRAELETKVEAIAVRPAGRSKWVSLDRRVTVRWRRGVRVQDSADGLGEPVS